MQLAPAVGQYALQEIAFALPGEQANPYDPDRIAVDGEFTSPSGRKLLVPAFYAEEGWKLRFAPVELGSYILRLKVSRNGQPAEESGIAAFDSVPSNRASFVRREGRYFKLDSGERFFPIGANRCWGATGRVEPYLRDMKALADAGANSLRVWLAPWWIKIETAPGACDPAAAARLDAIVRQAEALGLRLMICIEQHGNIQGEQGEIALWKAHPYNAANGGPCVRPFEFFFNSEARLLFRNRLRYLVARWGYSSSVMAWELFNEVELGDYGPNGFQDRQWQVVADWHREMARFLREHDPWGHMVATSSDIELQRRLFNDGALDMIQIHLYEGESVAARLAEKCSALARDENAPILVGEFGANGGVAPPELVTEGIAAAAMSGVGAGAWPWLQDSLDPAPAYERIHAVKQFLDSIRWEEERFQPVPAAVLRHHGGAVRTLGLTGRREMLVVAWPGPGSGDGEELVLRLGGLEGRFTCETRNLRTGESLGSAILEAANGALNLELPAFIAPVGFRLENLR